MKILFVKLPNARLYKSKNLTIIEPLGLEYLAAGLKDKHEVKLLDMDLHHNPADFLSGYLSDFQPDYVGTTVSTPMVLEAKRLVEKVRQVVPQAKVIVGGGHPSALPVSALKDTGADIAVVGEGEETIKEILEEGSLKKIKGIVYIDEGEYIQNSFREPIADLDDLPYPARDLESRELYRLSYSFGLKKQLCASVITSRSCPFDCIYCASRTIFGRKVRFRSVNNVVDELEYLKCSFGINMILFVDDCFTLRRERVFQICEEILSRNIKINWWLDTRIDKVSAEMLDIMKKAGCRFIVYGVEAGSQRMLDLIGKNIRKEEVIQTFRMTNDAGIDTKANFMLGHLDETEEEIWESINLAKELDPTRVGFYLVLPLPGSRLYDIAVDRQLIKKGFSEFKWYGEVVGNISKVRPERLKELQQTAYKLCPFKK